MKLQLPEKKGDIPYSETESTDLSHVGLIVSSKSEYISEEDLTKEEVYNTDVQELNVNSEESSNEEEKECTRDRYSEGDDFFEGDSEIDVSELYELKLKEREELGRKVKEWAANKQMALSFKGPERENIKLGNRVSILYCKRKQKHCPFYLEFRTNQESKEYELHQYYNCHNHLLEDFDSAQQITDKIFERIGLLKATGSETRVITDLINQEFKKKFHWRTIYYQLRKITDQMYGKISEDASKLCDLFEKDTEVRGSFSQVKKNTDENRLESCCFMSQRMQKLLEYFSDVIVIDTTHKSNRFNLPLMDVIVVNNMGHTCTAFFALLKNNTFEAYKWGLEHFKSRLKRNPSVIFTDDEETLTKGTFNFLLIL